MDCRASGGRAGLRSGTGGLHRRGRRRGLRRQRRMVPTRSARSLRSHLPRRQGIHEPGEHQQHDGEHHHDYQRLQHDSYQQNYERHQHYLCEPHGPGRSDGGSAGSFRRRPARSKSSGKGDSAANCLRAGKRAGCSKPHARSCVRRQGFQRGTCDRSTGSGDEPAGDRQEDPASGPTIVCPTPTSDGRSSWAAPSPA